MLAQIKKFVTPDHNDPDEIRKKSLIHILSLGLLIFVSLGLVLVVLFLITNPDKWRIQDNQLLVLLGVVGVIGSFIINRINQRTSKLSSLLLLLFLTIISVFSDTPEQLSNGRSLFVFMIPIAVSSLIFSPPSSFIFATINSFIIINLSLSSQTPPNITAVIVFYFFALISWLSSRSLEQALKDLRVINSNLDRLVAEKTQELAQTLSRELILAGRNHAILNSIADGVIVFDAENRSILANPALSQLTSTPLDALVNKGMMEFVQKEALAPSARGMLLGLFDHPEATPAGKRIVWGNKTLSASVARVQDDLGGNLGVVGVFRDVTREVELENMKNTFMAIVSHELRTPLSAILGFAEMLKEGVYGPTNDKQQNISERIMNNTQRLLGIVSDLLDQAQIEAGRLKIQIAPCKPAEMLDALQGVMTKIAADKGLEFNTDLDPALPPVILGDPQRLQQVMVNLANNAIKFTEQGSVGVKLSRLDGMNWQIHVTDTGGGIPNEARDYIFETFRQVDGASTRQHGGVGLGLSIVKQLVELMKGKIVVESEIGKGSTFIVTLPLLKHEGMSETTPR